MPDSQITVSVSLVEGRPATTSLKIAEHFGRRHCDVMRDIANLIEQCPENFHKRNFALMSRKVKIGNGAEREEPYYIVYFDGFMLLVMGYTGKKALSMKLAYIGAFNAMKEQLEAKEKPQLPNDSDTPIGPADQNILQTIVKTKAGALLDASHKGGFLQIWSRFNNHFRLGSYKQLPQSKMAEAVAYLVKLDVREKQKELPRTSAVLEQYSDKAQVALENVKDKSAQFMYALFDLQKAIDEKAAHKEAFPVAARQMSDSVRQMATSIGVSLSALTDLVEMYCGSLAPGAEQLPLFPSAVVTNIPGPRPGDRYYAYLEKVEAWRVATVAEREKLYREGITLLDVGRMGGEMFHVCADYLSLWLKDGILSSDTSVFDNLLGHNRAPVMLAKFLNTNFEDVRKYLK